MFAVERSGAPLTPPKQLPWVVIKYGGTSVATVETWNQILARVRLLLPTNRVWVVVSALSKVRRWARPARRAFIPAPL